MIGQRAHRFAMLGRPRNIARARDPLAVTRADPGQGVEPRDGIDLGFRRLPHGNDLGDGPLVQGNDDFFSVRREAEVFGEAIFEVSYRNVHHSVAL